MEAAPHPWPAIGSLMLRDGYVTKEQLEDVLRAQHDSPQQRISGWRLGELLVERGLMTQGQVAQLVAEQYELPYTELDPSGIDQSVVHLLSAEMVDRFSALPVETLPDGSLLLAVSDPATVLFSDELRRTLGRPLRFTVVAPDAMETAVASVRGEAPPERPSLSLAEWPSGAPAFDFATDDATSAGVDADTASTNGATAQAFSTPPLGTLLVRDGLVTEDELESALAEQRESEGKRLGEILVERGTLTRADVARVVAEQYELPFVDLASFELDHRVGALLPHDIAHRHSALPLDFLADGSLRVAVADPTKILAPEEILAVLGARLSFAVADPDAVEAAIEHIREQTNTVADSWATIAPVGPPVSRSDEHVHVDASDLIIVPADEAPAEPEAIERRTEPSAEHDEALGLAQPELADVTSEPAASLVTEPEHDPGPAPLDAEQPTELLADDGLEASAPVEPVAETRPKKRKRGWFRRRKHDADHVLAEDSGESVAEAPLTSAEEPADPITGLLLAGEASASGDAAVDDPSARATEQAHVLRLWIAGEEAPTLEPPPDGVEPEDAQDTAAEALVEAHEAEALSPEEPEETFDVGVDLADDASDAGLPELAGEVLADPYATAGAEPFEAETPAEAWNVFAPTPVGEQLEAPGMSDDAPPAELHDERSDADEAHAEHATDDVPASTAQTFEAWASAEPETTWEKETPSDADQGEDTTFEDTLIDEADTGLEAWIAPVEHDAEQDDAAEAAAVVETEWVETTSEEPAGDELAPETEAWHAAVEHEPEQDDSAEPTLVSDAEPTEDATVLAEQPSWASWEPAEGSADPWTATDTDVDEPVEAAAETPAEPWTLENDAEPEPAAAVADTAHADETTGDAWLAEIEPDSHVPDAAPWEVEDAPFAAAEHDQRSDHGVTGDEPPVLDLIVGMSAPDATDPTEAEPVEEPVAVAPVTVELVAEHVDRGTLAPLVERATALGASTVHFSAQEIGIVVRARIDGVLRKLDTVTGQARFELGRELGLAAQSGSLAGGHVTALPTPHGDTVTIRFRPSGDAATLDTLSLDPADREAFERALGHSFGLVLVAGPSGSGQASTLSAALHHLASGDRAVMTIEDPILHVVSGADQVAVDHSAGRGYADGLRTLLAADPDVVLVGELVDEETARLAVDAATGQLVVTTVLAQTAVGALDRLALLGVDTDLVASTLSLVVAQRLVRRLCDHCREGYYASAADAVALRRPEDEIGRRLLARGTGCAECGDTGFSGTIGAYEVLSPNDEVRALVAANAPAAELERAARLAGKRTLADDAIRLCLEGLTTVSEVQRVLGRALL